MVSGDALDEMQKERGRRVKAAEAHSGYREGGAMIERPDGGYAPCHVTVSFYGGVAWWIEIGSGKRRPLTPELWAKVQPLRV